MKKKQNSDFFLLVFLNFCILSLIKCKRKQLKTFNKNSAVSKEKGNNVWFYVVDTSLLRRLTSGHSKCPTKFYHLETSTWKLRHHLMYRRIMHHHHLVTRDKTETICKIYQQQKKDSIRDDWIELLKADFKSIKQELNEEEISSISKILCKKRIRQLINNSEFEYFSDLKNGHTKIVDKLYNKFQIQPYLTIK